MIVIQAYRFALQPTPAQERALSSHAGASRFAWNWGLARVGERYAAEGKWYSADRPGRSCAERYEEGRPSAGLVEREL